MTDAARQRPVLIASGLQLLTYPRYRTLIDELLAQGKLTSGEPTPDVLSYTRLNVQRMNRLDATVVIGDDLRSAVAAITEPQFWLVISEGWCGDAAQSVPMLAKAAGLNPIVSFHVILRDTHPEVMDSFLTNGTRSIPILVIADGATMTVLGVWGPRPAPAKAVVARVKSDPAASREDVMTALHGWYAADKTASAQHELSELLASIHAASNYTVDPTHHD